LDFTPQRERSPELERLRRSMGVEHHAQDAAKAA